MDANWKPVIWIAVVSVLVIGMQFGAYALSDANAAEVKIVGQSNDRKPDDATTTVFKTPRQKVCAELIGNIERAYRRDGDFDSYDARINLAATIQIYKDAKGPQFCYKYVINIMEDVKNGE